MMILITYDVKTITKAGQKRLRLVAKACKDYGVRVQNSVFECHVTNTQYITLKRRIDGIVDKETDNVRFYHMGEGWKKHVEMIGNVIMFDPTDELIV